MVLNLPSQSLTYPPKNRGADVSLGARSQQREAEAASDPNTDTYREWLRSFVANNLELTRTFYSHPKILVAALNGPAGKQFLELMFSPS